MDENGFVLSDNLVILARLDALYSTYLVVRSMYTFKFLNLEVFLLFISDNILSITFLKGVGFMLKNSNVI